MEKKKLKKMCTSVLRIIFVAHLTSHYGSLFTVCYKTINRLANRSELFATHIILAGKYAGDVYITRIQCVSYLFAGDRTLCISSKKFYMTYSFMVAVTLISSAMSMVLWIRLQRKSYKVWVVNGRDHLQPRALRSDMFYRDAWRIFFFFFLNIVHKKTNICWFFYHFVFFTFFIYIYFFLYFLPKNIIIKFRV